MAIFMGLTAQAQSDQDILNFALQLECLEGEFYNYAAGNGGLPASDRAGGPAPIGGKPAKLGGQTLVSCDNFHNVADCKSRHALYVPETKCMCL